MIHSIKLQSERGCIAELETYVKDVFDQFGIKQDLYPNILISLTEAVNNAVRHGNMNDERKVVMVSTTLQDTRVRCSISDEGSGFDFDNVPDPTAPENVAMEGGRGVFLMRQLADSVSFYDNGSTVEMEFRI